MRFFCASRNVDIFPGQELHVFDSEEKRDAFVADDRNVEVCAGSLVDRYAQAHEGRYHPTRLLLRSVHVIEHLDEKKVEPQSWINRAKAAMTECSHGFRGGAVESLLYHDEFKVTIADHCLGREAAFTIQGYKLHPLELKNMLAFLDEHAPSKDLDEIKAQFEVLRSLTAIVKARP